MEFNEYQSRAAKTAIYPEHIGLAYTALGLAGEAGEVADKVKKVYRDNDGMIDHATRYELVKEIGDVLWYVANLLEELNTDMVVAAEANLSKLESRKQRGVLSGSGDNR